MSNSFYLRVEDKEGSSAPVYTQSYRAIKRERKKKKDRFGRRQISLDWAAKVDLVLFGDT